jgi:signal transduction histidine kinase
MVGAMLRLKRETQNRNRNFAREESSKSINAMQEKFLNEFSFELASINKEILHTLEKISIQIDKSDTLQINFLDKASKGAKELGDYLDGIQQFIKLKNYKTQKLNTKEIDIKYLINRILNKLDSKTTEKNLNITLSCPDTLTLYTDQFLMEQIIFNLISNAINYSPEGGRIDINCHRNAKKFDFCVKDQGPGISDNLHEKIFEKFYRVKDDTAFTTKGHGLGLYLSRYFASLINGQITLQSTIGQGAEFKFTLYD